MKKKGSVKRKSSKTKRPAARRSVKKTRAKKGKVKRPVKGAKRKPKGAAELKLEKVGKVTHYFPHVKAAAVAVLKDSIRIGDRVYIKGHTTDFKEKVTSIQLNRVPIQEGKVGQEIGLLVKSRVRIGDSVYKV